MRDLPPLLYATHDHTVTDADTALHWRNELPVLATPVLLWLGEITAMAALSDHLEDGEMTVGLHHDSSHLAPTPPGRTVRLTATLRERTRNRLVFDVHGHDGVRDVLRGTHTRAVVDRAAFVAGLAEG